MTSHLSAGNQRILGIGADADVVIYEEEKDIAKMFSHPRYVLKGGEVVIAQKSEVFIQRWQA